MAILTPEQKIALKAKHDALGLGNLSPQAAAEALNAAPYVAGTPTTRPVPIADLQAYAFRIGFPARLNAALLVDATKVLAQTTLDLFKSRLDSVDTSDPAFAAMLQALQAASLLSAAEITAILAMAVVAAPGRYGATPFQGIAGVGDVPIEVHAGCVSSGTCSPEMIAEARS